MPVWLIAPVVLAAVVAFYVIKPRQRLDDERPEWLDDSQHEYRESGMGFSNFIGRFFGGSKVKRLEREILQTFGPLDDGHAIIQRRLQTLRRLHPDESEEWYYEKILYETQRDR
jgi:hypothetical protein